jgi:hypothetical protein
MGPPAAIFLRACYSLRRRAGREEPRRRKPVAFLNEKQVLIDMQVLLAES